MQRRQNEQESVLWWFQLFALGKKSNKRCWSKRRGKYNPVACWRWTSRVIPGIILHNNKAIFEYSWSRELSIVHVINYCKSIAIDKKNSVSSIVIDCWYQSITVGDWFPILILNRLTTSGQYLSALGMKIFSNIASCFFIFLSGYHLSFLVADSVKELFLAQSEKAI